MRAMPALLEHRHVDRRAAPLRRRRVRHHAAPVDQLVGLGEQVGARGGRVPEIRVVELAFRFEVEVLAVGDVFADAEEDGGGPVAVMMG